MKHRHAQENVRPDARRVLSLSNATTGALRAGALGVHAIGLGLAEAESLNSKHAIKQVDRLLSNSGLDVWELFESWVPFVLAQRKEAIVALDWTDFDSDGQSPIALHLITDRGRATPLVWKTVNKSELKENRNAYEDQGIARCLEVAPHDLKLTLLADRGFADQKLYDLLDRWGVSHVIRCRGSILVTRETGETRPAKDWVSPIGRAIRSRNASVTHKRSPLSRVNAATSIAIARNSAAPFVSCKVSPLTASSNFSPIAPAGLSSARLLCLIVPTNPAILSSAIRHDR